MTPSKSLKPCLVHVGVNLVRSAKSLPFSLSRSDVALLNPVCSSLSFYAISKSWTSPVVRLSKAERSARRTSGEGQNPGGTASPGPVWHWAWHGAHQVSCYLVLRVGQLVSAVALFKWREIYRPYSFIWKSLCKNFISAILPFLLATSFLLFSSYLFSATKR